jgi:arginine-tRNA-protein transferase
MIEETPVRSRVVEYTVPDGPGGRRRLVAVSLTDVLDDGLSMVYSFYEPEMAGQSLGTHVILDHVAMAREAGLPYVYLGYWVPGSRKMGYKSRFGALEIFYKGEWRDLGDPSQYSAARHPLSVDPIAEQVARLSLPDTRPTDNRPTETPLTARSGVPTSAGQPPSPGRLRRGD